MAADIKTRRKALGLARAQLAAYAYVDPRTLQLLEMGQQRDAACEDRLSQTLDALEAGREPPRWKQQVDEAIDAEGSGHVVTEPGGSA